MSRGWDNIQHVFGHAFSTTGPHSGDSMRHSGTVLLSRKLESLFRDEEGSLSHPASSLDWRCTFISRLRFSRKACPCSLRQTPDQSPKLLNHLNTSGMNTPHGLAPSPIIEPTVQPWQIPDARTNISALHSQAKSKKAHPSV